MPIGIFGYHAVRQIRHVQTDDTAGKKTALGSRQLNDSNSNDSEECQSNDPDIFRAAIEILIKKDNTNEGSGIKGGTGRDNGAQPRIATAIDQTIVLIGAIDPIFIPIVGQVNENNLLQQTKDRGPESRQPKIEARKEGRIVKENGEEHHKGKDTIFGGPQGTIELGLIFGGHGHENEEIGGDGHGAKDAGVSGTLLHNSERGGLGHVLGGVVGTTVIPSVIDGGTRTGNISIKVIDPALLCDNIGTEGVLKPQR